MSLLYDYTEIHIPDAAHLKCYMSTHLIMTILVFQIPKLAGVGLYSSWGSIVSKSVLDWGCITF